jgi:acetyl esterase
VRVLLILQNFALNTNKFIIGGYSAGGGIAALVTIKARSDQGINISHQFLMSPATDLSHSIHSHDDYEAVDKICTAEVLEYLSNYYLPEGIGRDDSRVSPYWEKDLSDLPPTTIIVAEFDGLRSDAEGYAKRLKEAGNKVEKIVVAGQTHNYLILKRELSGGIDPVELVAEKLREKGCVPYCDTPGAEPQLK